MAIRRRHYAAEEPRNMMWLPSLYFAKGLPYVIVMVTALLFFKQMGLSNAQITFYTSWLYLPWVMKPLWGPFVDRAFSKRWWMIATELLIGAALGGIALTIPTSFKMQGSLCLLFLIAFANSTHNVVTDRYYNMAVKKELRMTYRNVREISYRIAMIVGQGVLVMFAGNVQVLYRNSISYSWCLLFYFAAGMMLLLWLWHTQTLPHLRLDRWQYIDLRDTWSEISITTKTFFRKPKLWFTLLFIMFFRLPEALINKVSVLFLVDYETQGGLGLAPQEYAFTQGTLGIVGFTLGAFLGFKAIRERSFSRCLWPMALSLLISPVIYLALSLLKTQDITLISLCIFIEQTAYAFGTTAYLAFISQACSTDFTLHHRTMCKAFVALSLMLPAMISGLLQSLLGYQLFFVLALVCGVCTILLTLKIKNIED